MCKDQAPGLGAAYALRTPEDSIRLYADWANSYDSDFVATSDYILHIQVTRMFAQQGGEGPVLDIGAGTGILAEALAQIQIGPIDATDISQEMLDVAKAKNIYRKLFTTTHLVQSLRLPVGTALARTNRVITMSFQK